MPPTYRDRQKAVVARLSHGPARAQPPWTPMPGERCLTSVVFVPPEVAATLQREVTAPLRAIEPHHHYHPPAAMHLTIKSVRRAQAPPAFGEADVATAAKVFADVVPRHRPFAFALAEVAVFAGSAVVVGYCDERLRELVLELDAALRAAGVPDDKPLISDTVFFGNVTICRFRSPPSDAFLERAGRLSVHAEVPVHTISLVACDSVCDPATRQVVGEYAL